MHSWNKHVRARRDESDQGDVTRAIMEAAEGYSMQAQSTKPTKKVPLCEAQIAPPVKEHVARNLP